MLRITDRHEKELLYGPTNEEMITLLAKALLKAIKIYQDIFIIFNQNLEMK